MPIVNLTIDGRKVQAEFGQTVLQTAEAAGIYIPVLCAHPALRPEGACRICLVEIERQKALQPACTFPVSEGLVIHTDSPKVVEARKFVLELIFSERSHYCMYCAESGSDETTQCELQRLGYQNGLTHWPFPANTSISWPVDASRKYFFMDHSRCILCRRCVRACADIVANHTMGINWRGARSMAVADGGALLGESTCVSCGTCLQVCPTGALIDRRSAYMGGACQVQSAATTCMACPVGCGIEAVTRSNMLLRIESDWDAANGGLLCVTGRFEVCEPQPERVKAPMVRRDGALQAASWGDALAMAAEMLKEAGSVAGLATPRATVESLTAFKQLFDEALHTQEVALLYGELPKMELGPRATLQDVPSADLIVVAGAQPLQQQKVVGYLVKRGVDKGARLIIISDTPTELDPWAIKRIPLAEAAQLEREAAAAQQPVVLYGVGLPDAVTAALAGLGEQARYLPLYDGTNAAGAAELGLVARPVQGNVLYVLAGDDLPAADDGHLPPARFTVVQAAYRSAWTDAADVVLPARVWTEQEGHIVNLEGRNLPVVPVTVAPADVEPDTATLARVADRLAAAVAGTH